MKHLNKYLLVTTMLIMGSTQLKADKYEDWKKETGYTGTLKEKSYEKNLNTIKGFQTLIEEKINFVNKSSFDVKDPKETLTEILELKNAINVNCQKVLDILAYMTGISLKDRQTLFGRMEKVKEQLDALDKIKPKTWEEILAACKAYKPIKKASIFTFITTTKDLRDGVNGITEAFNDLMQQLAVRAQKQIGAPQSSLEKMLEEGKKLYKKGKSK